MHGLSTEVYEYCLEKGLLYDGIRVIVGISGGADSVCLLKVLLEISEVMKMDIVCVHVEHGIRGEESRRDRDFVKDLCDKCGIMLKIHEEDVPARAKELKMTVEEAGRYIRYEAFEEERRAYGADAIAVAHHMDDQAETVLFNISRGSGLRGAAGIAPKRGNIIRPLLMVNRAGIEAYLSETGQDHCTDSTNEDTLYSRNRIRNLVLPELERVVKGASRHIAELAGEMREADAYIRDRAGEVSKEAVRVCGPRDGRVYEIDRSRLIKEPEIIGRYVVRSVLAEIYTTYKDLGSIHVNDVLRLCSLQSGKKIILPKGVVAAREGNVIRISSEGGDTGTTAGIYTELNIGEDTVIPGYGKFHAVIRPRDPDMVISNEVCTKWFDYDKINGGLFVRNRREGDYLTFGENGHRKKLKKYLIDEKVPASKRESLLLIADGDHVVWVVGKRISGHYKVTAETVRVLEVTFTEAGPKEKRYEG